MINGYFGIDGRPTIRGIAVSPGLDAWEGVLMSDQLGVTLDTDEQRVNKSTR